MLIAPPATLFSSCFLIFLHLFWILQCFFLKLLQLLLWSILSNLFCFLCVFYTCSYYFLPLCFSILNKFITISVGFTVFTLLHNEKWNFFRLRFSVHADNIPTLFLNSLTPPLATSNSIVFSPPPFSFRFLSCPSSFPLSQRETGRKYVMTPP